MNSKEKPEITFYEFCTNLYNGKVWKFYVYIPLLFAGISIAFVIILLAWGIALSGYRDIPTAYKVFEFFALLPFNFLELFITPKSYSNFQIILLNMVGWAVIGLLAGTLMHIRRMISGEGKRR